MNCLTDLVESIGVNSMILTEHAYISISISISISFGVIRYSPLVHLAKKTF